MSRRMPTDTVIVAAVPQWRCAQNTVLRRSTVPKHDMARTYVNWNGIAREGLRVRTSQGGPDGADAEAFQGNIAAGSVPHRDPPVRAGRPGRVRGQGHAAREAHRRTGHDAGHSRGETGTAASDRGPADPSPRCRGASGAPLRGGPRIRRRIAGGSARMRAADRRLFLRGIFVRNGGAVQPQHRHPSRPGRAACAPDALRHVATRDRRGPRLVRHLSHRHLGSRRRRDDRPADRLGGAAADHTRRRC